MSVNDALQEFLDWSRKNGVIFDGLEIRTHKLKMSAVSTLAMKVKNGVTVRIFNTKSLPYLAFESFAVYSKHSKAEAKIIDFGKGVFATRTFRTDEKLIQLPESLMITAGKVAEMKRYAELLSNTRFLPSPFEMLTLFFCLEDIELSWYAPYLKVLPPSFNTPAYIGQFIDEADLPASVRDFWCTQQKDLQEMWKRVHDVVPWIPHEKFLWAWHVVNTRCIYVENKLHPSIDNSAGDTLAVIPFVDMLNHEPLARSIAMFDRYSNTYIVGASHCVLENEQVTVCYGPHDNARLWMEYGFTLPNNPNGKVLMEHALFIALAKKVGVDVSPLHEEALREAGLPCSLYLSDEGPSWSLRVNMKILMLSPSDIKRWREIIYVERPRSASRCLQNDKDHELTKQELSELRTLQQIIGELRKAVASRMTAVPQETQWIWEEQVVIIDVVLSSFTK